MICFLIGLIAFVIIVGNFMLLFLDSAHSLKEKDTLYLSKPFLVSECYERMEKAALNILDELEPVDQTIILWWGLDGILLNENGELEWISRKKQSPVELNISNQMCQFEAQPTQIYMADNTIYISASNLTQCCCDLYKY